MIFASDLDRTLIYSQRALEDYPAEDNLDLVSVERKLEKDISFMTSKSLEYLQEIATKLLFVPVTTRSLAQFQRVSFHDISFPYVITTNGANILYKDKPLAEWNEMVKTGLNELSIGVNELSILLNKYLQKINGDIRVVEDLFVYFHLREMIAPTFVKELSDFMKEKGWKVSLQGRKLYFVPTIVSKGRALKYIQEREEETTLIGAGDSLFDDDFLQHCQFPFVLGHGELAAMDTIKPHYKIIEPVGVKGGEELLRKILKLIEI